MTDKTSIADWSTTADDNDNIAGITLEENKMRPRDVNGALRELMAQVKDGTGLDLTNATGLGSVGSGAGALPVANGGTAGASANAAKINLLLPEYPDRVTVKAIDPTVFSAVFINEGGRAGVFLPVLGTQPYTDASEGAMFTSTANAGYYWARLRHELTPADFGASSTPAATVTDAFQAMVDFVRQTYNSNAGGFTYKCDLGGRAWVVDASINATQIRQPGFSLGNGVIYSKATNKIALDLGATNSPRLHKLLVYGDKTDTPWVGIYQGVAEYPTDSGTHVASTNGTYDDVATMGYFSRSAAVFFGAEVLRHNHLNIHNSDRSTGAAGLVCCGNYGTLDYYLGGLTSDYAAIPTSGNFSNTLISLGDAAIQRASDVNIAITGITQANPAVVSVDAADLTASALANGDKVALPNIVGMTELNTGLGFTVANIDLDAGTFELSGIDSSSYGTFTSGTLYNQTGPAMILNGTQGISMDEAYILSYGSNCPIWVDLTNGVPIDSVDIKCSAENQPRGFMRMDLSTSGTVTVEGLRLKLNSQYQNFKRSVFVNNVTGGGTVKINGLRLDIGSMGTAPPNHIFDTPADFALNDFNIHVPLSAALNDFSSGFANTPAGRTAADDGSPVVKFWGKPNFVSGLTLPNSQSFVPTVTAASGTITAATATLDYQSCGIVTMGQITIVITTNGTGSGSVVATLPFTASVTSVWAGRNNSNGKMLQGDVSSATLTIYNYDNTYPGADGAHLFLSGPIFTA